MPAVPLDDLPPAADPAGAALDRDVYCPGCRYNLRGLAGDPVRCPECGRASTRSDLFGENEQAAERFRDLRRALDTLVLGLLTAVPVAALCVYAPRGISGAGIIAAGLALLVGGVILGAVLEIRHLTTHPDWARALAGYLGSTLLLLAALPAVGTSGMGITWGVLSVLGYGRQAGWLCALGGVVGVVLVLAHGRLIPTLRRLQARRFARFLQIARAIPHR